MVQKPIGLIVCDSIKISYRISATPFGEIYLAHNKDDLQEKYAVKFQRFSSRGSLLHSEAKIYQHMISKGRFKGLPEIFIFKTQKQYHILIMELLGPSINDLFNRKNNQFCLKNALIVGYQMVQKIRQIHKRDILHRDIKPDNFLIGTEENSKFLFIIDFNLSKKYIRDGQHIPYKEGKQMVGAPRYASVNNHRGIQSSRRDDIQSIGYVIMYLLRGSLPWQNLSDVGIKTKNQLIFQKKLKTSAEQLCRNYPKQLTTFIKYARNLNFEQQPNYEYLLNLLTQAMHTTDMRMDFMLDQHELKREQQNKKNPQRIQNKQLRRSSFQIHKNLLSKSKQKLKINLRPEKQLLKQKVQNILINQDNKAQCLNRQSNNTPQSTVNKGLKLTTNRKINLLLNQNVNRSKRLKVIECKHTDLKIKIEEKQKQNINESSNGLHRNKSKSTNSKKISNSITLSNLNIQNNLRIRNQSMPRNNTKI